VRVETLPFILSMLSKPWGSLPYSIACCVIAAIAGCSKPASPHEAASSQPVDPCSLLTNDDIRSVQGEEIIDKKASGSTSGEFAISQCYFTTKTPVNSVVITVTQRGSTRGARGVRELWRETFNPGSTGRREEGEQGREEEHEAKPERVEGVADEAYWAGSRFGGALYALKGDSYQIRISVGGAGDAAAKKKKCTALAELILKRL
jgi:hypothetical protein